MIEGGIEYGLLTMGEEIVFLKIDWADPTILYYHLAEPGPDEVRRRDPPGQLSAGDVGDVLAARLLGHLGSVRRLRSASVTPVTATCYDRMTGAMTSWDLGGRRSNYDRFTVAGGGRAIQRFAPHFWGSRG